LGHRFGEWAERAGGLVLIGIGVRILVQHLTG
jgi:putative Mn2+ efflux pump MntP